MSNLENYDVFFDLEKKNIWYLLAGNFVEYFAFTYHKNLPCKWKHLRHQKPSTTSAI